MSLELQHDFTFNPDGSGRVTVRWSSPLGPESAHPDDFVRHELERAAGVDAWADVVCAADGEHLVFTATAWFRSAEALRFYCQGFHFNLLDFRVAQQPDGAVVIASLPDAARELGPELAADATADDIAAVMIAEREKLQMARGIVAEMFGGLRCEAVLRAPAPFAGSPRGERIAANAVRVTFEGKNLVAILDRLLNDDAAMTKLLRQGAVTPTAALELLGDQGPVDLRTEPGASAQFDYEQEVAAAQANFAGFAASLGAAVRSAEPAEPLDNVRLIATKIVFEADSDRELCPQGQNFRGVCLTIAGDLPRQALEVDDACFECAIDDQGVDRTPKDEWDRRCHFPKLTNDGRTVFLDVSLPIEAGQRGLSELSGRLLCLSSEGSVDTDLGFAELTPGATGSELGAQLLRIDQEDEQRWTLEVQLQVSRHRLLACRIDGDDGSMPLSQCGYSSCNDECTMTYQLDGAMPANGRMIMTVAANLNRVAMGFMLTGVDWLGQPLAN